MSVIAAIPRPQMPEADRALTRSTMLIGMILYAAGTLSFAGIFAAFFALRLYAISTESRFAFMVLFTGLFCAFQGLVFILVARSKQTQREQMDFMLDQIRIIYSSSAEDLPAPPGSEHTTPRK